MNPNTQVLKQFLRSPEAEQYLKARQEYENRQKLRGGKLPLWALGSVGAGAGLYGLGSWILRPEDAKNLQELMAMNSMVEKGKVLDDWKNPTEFYTQYLDRAGRAARARMFGGRVSGQDAMVFYRKHIEPLVGGKYPITNDKELADANEHYATFASGPLLSHLHMLKKLTALNSKRVTPEAQQALLQNEANLLSEQSGLKPERLLDLKNPIKPGEASFSDQLQAVRAVLYEHSKHVGDQVSKLIPSLAAGNASAVSGYAPLNNLIQAAHSIPRAAGLGLAGAGLVGLGGWGAHRLYNRLTKGRQDAEAARELNQLRSQAAKTYSERTMKTAALSAARLLAFRLTKSAADTVGKELPVTPSIPPRPITVTTPPGMEWDWPGQETEFQDIIRKTRPDLSAHLVRGHGGGVFGSYSVRARSRGAVDLESLLANARNTRTMREVMQAVKRKHQGMPDLLFLGQCNKQYCDVPMDIKDAVGTLPNRLVYTAPGGYSNTGVSREALRYALNEPRGLLLPKEQEFSEGPVKVRARLQPLISPNVSIPVAGAGLAMLANEVIQRRHKAKNPWWRRLAFGAGGAALGGAGILIADKLRRTRANDHMYVPNYLDPSSGTEIAPLVADA